MNAKRPYFNPCIISSIKEYFFTGSRGSLAQRYDASFSSSIKDGPEKNELELPIPMVCLVATTVSVINYILLLYITESNRVMLHLTTGLKVINGPKATSGLIAMNRFTVAMSSFSKLFKKLIRDSITP